MDRNALRPFVCLALILLCLPACTTDEGETANSSRELVACSLLSIQEIEDTLHSAVERSVAKNSGENSCTHHTLRTTIFGLEQEVTLLQLGVARHDSEGDAQSSFASGQEAFEDGTFGESLRDIQVVEEVGDAAYRVGLIGLVVLHRDLTFNVELRVNRIPAEVPGETMLLDDAAHLALEVALARRILVNVDAVDLR